MATEKQIAANRANAQKSTGPRTPEGKAKVARNGIRHGMLAQCAVLRSECGDTFRAFVARFYQEFQPATPTECEWIDTMASARWRLIRLLSLETARLDHESGLIGDEGLSGATLTVLAHQQAICASPAFESLNRAEARIQRTFDNAYRQLREVQTERRKLVNGHGQIEPPPAYFYSSNPIPEPEENGEPGYLPVA